MQKKSTHIYDSQLKVHIGTLTEFVNNGKTSYTVEYHKDYLCHQQFITLDPLLYQIPGVQLLTHFPLVLKDASPDNYGRKLWQKANPNNHSELDLALSINNLYRKGSIELSGSATGTAKTVREIEHLITSEVTPLVAKKLLSVGSSSLGGARRKTTVVHEGLLYVAKFPILGDRHGTAQDEHTATKYMHNLGVKTARTHVEGDVLLSERFDRGQGRKLGFVSLASYLGVDPADTHDYLDVLDQLQLEDKLIMFKQIVGNTVLHNADDHLNNYGMIRRDGIWRLSPAFDINAVEDLNTVHSTSLCGQTSYVGFMKNLPEVAKYLSISEDDYSTFLDKAFFHAGRLVFTHINMKERIEKLKPHKKGYPI